MPILLMPRTSDQISARSCSACVLGATYACFSLGRSLGSGAHICPTCHSGLMAFLRAPHTVRGSHIPATSLVVVPGGNPLPVVFPVLPLSSTQDASRSPLPSPPPRLLLLPLPALLRLRRPAIPLGNL